MIQRYSFFVFFLTAIIGLVWGSRHLEAFSSPSGSSTTVNRKTAEVTPESLVVEFCNLQKPVEKFAEKSPESPHRQISSEKQENLSLEIEPIASDK